MADLGTGDRRPPSEALLWEAKEGGRGSLKIFVGVAPGVSKTFEMLTAALAKRRDGADLAVTHVLIAEPLRPWWWHRLFSSPAERFIRRVHGANVHVITGQPQAGGPEASSDATRRALSTSADPGVYFGGLVCAIIALAVGVTLQRVTGTSGIALTFLTAVLTSAPLFGLWPSLSACPASVAAYKFSFSRRFTLTITDPNNVVTLFFFAVVAVIASKVW